MNFFFRFYNFIARRPKLVLRAVAAITALFLSTLVAFSSLQTDAFDFIDQKYLAGLLEVREKFGERTMMSVTLQDRTGKGMLSIESLREQDRFFTEIERHWPVVVESLTEIINSRLIQGVRNLTSQDAANALIIELYREDSYEFERVARKSISDQSFVDKLQEANILTHISGVPLGIVQSQLPLVEAVRAVITPSAKLSSKEIGQIFSEIRVFAELYSEAFTPRLYATELINEDLDQRVLLNAPFLTIFMVVLLSVVLWIIFKSKFFVAVPMIVLGLMVIWTFGFGTLLGIRRYAFNHILVIPLLLGQCIDNLIHFNERFREEYAKDIPKEEALKIVFGTAGKAALLTTAINITSFTADIFTTTLRPVIEYALLIVFGLGLALLLTYTVNIACFMLYQVPRRPVGVSSSPVKEGSQTARRFFDWIIRKRKLVLTAGLILIILSSINILRINRNFEITSFLPDSAPTKKSYQYERDHFTLYNPHYVLIEGDATDPAVFEAVAGVEATLKTFPEVEQIHGRINTESLSYLYSKFIPKTIPERPKDAYAAFFKSNAIINRLTNETVGELSSRLIEHSNDSYPATLVKFWPAQRTSAAIKQLGEMIDNSDPPGEPYQISAVGDFLAFSRTVDNILVSAVKATFLTFFIIILIFLVLHRSLATSLIMIIPVAFGAAVGFGSLPILGIGLNALNGTIGVLALGLGVDYSIQLMTRYREEQKKHSQPEQAMREAFSHIALPLAGCALMTVAGLLVLIGLLPITAKFGVASALSLLSSYLASVTVLPILIVAFDARKRG